MSSSQLYEIRKQWGANSYITVFNDDFVVPWKPLSMGEYIQYSKDYNRNHIVQWELEDEIFLRCVLDASIKRQIKFLKAGIITTVVKNIWQHSGPLSISTFNNDLENTRFILHQDTNHIIHELVQIITMAFPYKPEEVYEMEYETFLFRLAQAEKKLIDLHMIEQPINLIDTTQEKAEGEKLRKQVENRPRIDAKKLWETQKEKKTKKPATSSPQPTSSSSTSKDKWWDVSPVLEATGKHNIDFSTETKEQDFFGLTGHEKADAHIERAKMLKDTMWVYKDLIDNIGKKHK